MAEITLEDIARFAWYYKEHPTWGSLHIVLDDGNVEDSNVEFCRQYAFEQRDLQGMYLASRLLELSKSQRGRIGRKAEEVANELPDHSPV